MVEQTNGTLDENRIIYVSGDFNESMAKTICTKLLEFDCKSPGTDILMVIDSRGGALDSFIAIHDMMEIIESDVATLCIGKAASCGQMLLMSGAKGKRFITRNSRIFIHEISGGMAGKAREIEIHSKEMKRLQANVSKMILKYTNLTKKQLDDIFNTDEYYNAIDSKKLGFVDHIITNVGSVFKYLSN